MGEPSEVLLTLLMTVRNGSLYISDAVNSILMQTYRHFKFLILDNASSDDTVKIIKSFNDNRIKLIELSSDIGQTQALNMGLKMINTKYTARMDADDISLPDRFEKQINHLEKNPNICFVGTNHIIIDKNNNNIGFYNWPSNSSDCDFTIIIKGQPPVGHPMVMFRTKEVIELGGYNLDFKFGQDMDLWFRGFEENYKFNNIQHKLVKYRKFDTQASYTNLNELESEGNVAYVELINRINYLKNKYSDSVYINLGHINKLIRNAPNKINSFLEVKAELIQYFFSKHSFNNNKILSYTAKLWVHLFPYILYNPIKILIVIIKNTILCYFIVKKNISLNPVNFIYYTSIFFYFCFKDFNKVIFNYFFANIKPRMISIIK